MSLITFVDIETTNTNPLTGLLLEVGLLVADEHWRVLDEIEFSICQPDLWDHKDWAPEAADMHATSGLMDRCLTYSNITQAEAERLLVAWMEERGLIGSLMGGSNVHFDRSWLSVQMPDLHGCFTYRNFDVSSIRTWLKVEKDLEPDVGPKLHRSLADLRRNLEELKELRRELYV